MPEVILKILAVLGVLLLILLGAVLLLLLLVLFVPVTYKVKGVKNSEKAELSARARWMFGLLRVRYAYPEPGRLTVKILWFTLLGAEKKGRKPKKKSKEDTADADKKAGEADKKAAKPDKKTTEAN